MTSWKLETDAVVELEQRIASPGEADQVEQNRHIRHLFQPADVHAINAALASGRPLLVRGEAGVGKSQLARAAAQGLGRLLVTRTINAATESQDLLWTFDAVRRLADAQLLGSRGTRLEDSQELLKEHKYVCPGPLWWGFDWNGAARQAQDAKAPFPAGSEGVLEAPRGVVVLLDEIDKADSSVPNGLLECLGNRQFPGPGGDVVRCEKVAPLVLVTTNEERSLPDAFLRRCLVLQMSLPRSEDELLEWLRNRGRAHFDAEALSDEILQEAAEMLVEDRFDALRRGLAPPGGAEYLDLLLALHHLGHDTEERKELLGELRDFTFRKHPPEETLK